MSSFQESTEELESSRSFQLFESFDFENNSAFQAGWQSIKDSMIDQPQESAYLRAKSFFFSKHVCTFDLSEYLVWKSFRQDQGRSLATTGEANPTDITKLCIGSETESKDTEKSADIGQDIPQSTTSRGQMTASNQQLITSEHDHRKSTDSHETNNFSLASIAEMIKNNQSIPGVVSIDVQPTNLSPTASLMVRKLKPWESIK